MTEFWLVRHGSTDGLGQRLAGRTRGIALNARGRTETQVLARRLTRYHPEHVYTSPLQRTQETARGLAVAAGCGVTLREDLAELDYGDWTGQLISELAHDERFQRYNRFRCGSGIPGGETMWSAQARAVSALADLRASHPRGGLVIVTHADIIKACVMQFLGIGLDQCHSLEVAPASITRIALSEDHACVRSLNDTAHLELEH